MIVGTAGHIDHGKSTLVRRLTGTDPDRLPEEKRRAITIELGYAFLETPAGARVGFVDVPGHERLLHTMLAGATGVDAALLVVAADDGVMPQTREHLAVLALLGIARGALVISKCDRVDSERIAQVTGDVRALAASTGMHDAPLFEVSALDDQGVDALTQWLCALADGDAAAADARGRAGNAFAFRMPIDRVFALKGVGTIVTGTASAGSTATGAELAIVPGTSRTATARVRSLHAQSRATDRAQASQRCALNLAGVTHDELRRGQWIVDRSIALQTDRIDVELTLWHEEARPLRSGASVHTHAGADDVMARIVLLDGDELKPGAMGLAQLVLREPIATWRGDRIVLRDASATRTLGGARVLDPFAPARYRRSDERRAMLCAFAVVGLPERLAAVCQAAPYGIDALRWAQTEGITLSMLDQLAAQVDARSLSRARLSATATAAATATATARAATDGPHWLIGRAAWQALQQALHEALAAFHVREPDSIGIDAHRLRRLAAQRAPQGVIDAVIDEMIEAGHLARRGAFIHLSEHRVQLSPTEERLAQRIVPRLLEGAFDPPWARDLARDLTVSEATMRSTLARMAMLGMVFQVVRDLFYPAATVERLASIARTLAVPNKGVEATAFRDATGLGRKRAIQILEFFDRIGLLRRVRDVHMLRTDTRLFADAVDTSSSQPIPVHEVAAPNIAPMR